MTMQGLQVLTDFSVRELCPILKNGLLERFEGFSGTLPSQRSETLQGRKNFLSANEPFFRVLLECLQLSRWFEFDRKLL